MALSQGMQGPGFNPQHQTHTHTHTQKREKAKDRRRKRKRRKIWIPYQRRYTDRK
jgi:hypothetical protein